MITIGQKIYRQRTARGWSRWDLHDKTGYSEEAIRLWEIDKVKPSEPAIRSLERAFGEQLRK